MGAAAVLLDSVYCVSMECTMCGIAFLQLLLRIMVFFIPQFSLIVMFLGCRCSWVRVNVGIVVGVAAADSPKEWPKWIP